MLTTLCPLTVTEYEPRSLKDILTELEDKKRHKDAKDSRTNSQPKTAASKLQTSEKSGLERKKSTATKQLQKVSCARAPSGWNALICMFMQVLNSSASSRVYGHDAGIWYVNERRKLGKTNLEVLLESATNNTWRLRKHGKGVKELVNKRAQTQYREIFEMLDIDRSVCPPPPTHLPQPQINSDM